MTVGHDPASLLERYRAVRGATERLAAPLSPEDQTIQSMPDVSPTKWHRAHTTWFFETFVLSPHVAGYRMFDPAFAYLFNSYYEAAGPRHPRPRRGLLSRPSADDVARYRAHVDDAMAAALGDGRLDPHETGDAGFTEPGIVELGLQHEQQHQELLLMDAKHVLSCNPTDPAYAPEGSPDERDRRATPARFVPVAGGTVQIGDDGRGFAFDNERPQHAVHLEDFGVADRLVCAGEWLAFIDDGGYERPELWLSDGWHTVQEQGWRAPLYWSRDDSGTGDWTVFTLGGRRLVDPAEPVVHVSHYEADAYARWCGARLPTEFEWEHAVRTLPTGSLREVADEAWQWTASAYLPYPRFRPAPGAVGEYNGKFMSGQITLRGGARITPAGHARPTYRNFFPPASRWMYGGVRIARDA